MSAVDKKGKGRRRQRPASINDVARLAATSVTTVSNFLNGRSERMASDTIGRVEAAISELGYRPSYSARQLKTGFIPVLGLLVPSVANPFHGILARHIEEAALARGYQVVFGSSLRDPVRELRYAEDFWTFGIRGLILGSSPLELGHLADLASRGLRIVVLDRSVSPPDFPFPIDTVSMDNVRAGYLATRHLLDLGHQRIGYVSGATPTASRRDRLEGYHLAMRDAGISVDPVWVSAVPARGGYDDTNAADLGRLITAERLSSDPQLTGLVALNDMYALGACSAIRERGHEIPGDVSIVSIDDVLANLVHPALTAVHHPIEALCVAAVERLIGRLQGGEEMPSRNVTMTPEIVVRRSTGVPRTQNRRPAPPVNAAESRP